MDALANDQLAPRQHRGFALYSDERHERGLQREVEEHPDESGDFFDDETMPDLAGIEAAFDLANGAIDSTPVEELTQEPAATGSAANQRSAYVETFNWSDVEKSTEKPAASGSIIRKRSADPEAFHWADAEPPKIPRIKKYLTTGDNRGEGVDVLHFGGNDKKGSLTYTRFDSFPKALNNAFRGLNADQELSDNPYAKALFNDPMRRINVAEPPHDTSAPSTTISPNRLRSTTLASPNNVTPPPKNSQPPMSTLSTGSPESRTPSVPLSPSDLSTLLARHSALRAKHIAYDDVLHTAAIKLPCLTRSTRTQLAETVNRPPNLVADFRILAQSQADPAAYLEEQDRAWERALMQQLVVRKRDWLGEQAKQVERMLKAEGVEVEAGVESRKGRGKIGRVRKRDMKGEGEMMSAREILRVVAGLEGLKVVEDGEG